MSRICLITNCSDTSTIDTIMKRYRRFSALMGKSLNSGSFSEITEIETLQAKLRFKKQSIAELPSSEVYLFTI